MRTKIHLGLCAVLLIIFVCKAGSEGTSSTQTYNLDPVFFLLGSTDEYMGRSLGKNTDYLEHFYASEESAAKLYAVYLERALSARYITNGYSVAVSDDGGHISFRSKQMKRIINSYYEEVEGDIFGNEIVGKLKVDIFAGNRDLQLAYLAGAYSRYGESNAFYFANSIDKVERVLEEIQRFNCEEVVLTRKYTFPTSSTITFDPGELDRFFAYITDQKKDANQRVDLTVKSPVELGNEQGTAGHP